MSLCNAGSLPGHLGLVFAAVLAFGICERAFVNFLLLSGVLSGGALGLCALLTYLCV